jgi:RimJ/RimL family protein N-acetyltransferase
MFLSEIVQHNLTLRNFTPDQVSEEYVSWLGNPVINRFLEVRHEKVTLSSQRKLIEVINDSEDTSIFVIFFEHKLMVGTIKVGPINSFHKTANIGLLVGSSEYHGRGIGTVAIGALCETLSKGSIVRKVNAGVISENVASLKAFKKNGFVTEGILKGQFLDENKVPLDVVLLGRLLNVSP